MREDGRTNPNEATIILETRFGPDYITVEDGIRMDGIRITTIDFDETTDPIDGYRRCDISFHADTDIPLLKHFRHRIDESIRHLEGA